MVEKAARVGAQLKDRLAAIRSQKVREVRGRGLLLAVESHADAGGAWPVCEALQARGLLAKKTHDHTIRIAPPLILTTDQADGSAISSPWF